MASISITTRLQQTTKLSPAQIQIIRMLELPAVELQQRVNEELQENPALEEGRDMEEDARMNGDSDDEFGYNEEEDWQEDENSSDDDLLYEQHSSQSNYEDDYGDSDDIPEYATRTNNTSPDDDMADTRETNYSGGTSLMEHLKSQVYLTKMTKPERHIAKWVLGNIDEDGFLRRSTEQLVDDLSFQEGIQVSDEKMEEIVAQIKQFDPAGVAAYDLQECLLNQLKQKSQTESVQNATRILSQTFDSFTKRHFDKVSSRLDLTEEQLKDAIDEITHLNQKPANAFTSGAEGHKETIIPDFYVENRDGELVLILNTGDIPELHVSRDYLRMQEQYKNDKETMRFLKQKIDSASIFIDAIAQRNETLKRTMAAILRFQMDFFIEGDDAYLKPMILQDIADETGYDVSTISRVSNSKHVQTEFGIFPLKHFFSESMTNIEGSEVSTREIKKILGEVIAKEDKRSPLNDDKLVEVLHEHGYLVARRTIAKYREQLGIPVARLRKEI